MTLSPSIHPPDSPRESPLSPYPASNLPEPVSESADSTSSRAPITKRTHQLRSHSTSCSSQQSPLRRTSIFKEVGLDNIDEPGTTAPTSQPINKRPRLSVRFRSTVEEIEHVASASPAAHDSVLRRKVPRTSGLVATMPRVFMFAVFLAIFVPSFHSITSSRKGTTPIGATAGPIEPLALKHNVARASLEPRQDPTQYCKRWSHQAAVINGTMYLYGGRMVTDQNQTTNEWSKYR